VVQRKTSDPASKEYWASIDKLTREVKEMPSWMKPQPSPTGNAKPTATTKKPER
jgi:hypothetical protein